MTLPAETLTIALEDVGATSWWARILTTLSSQYGSTQQRFVGKVNGRTRYKSSTFPAAGAVSPMPPQEQWAPGMTAALEELRRDLAKDGWEQISRGKDPWSLAYKRVVLDLPHNG
ncbi:hypothetical protein [Arthrobacter sp. TMS1-12-1]